jgi:DNA-binding NtrC family response regulator
MVTVAPTVLVVTSDPYVVSLVESVKPLLPGLQFEICCGFSQVDGCLKRESISLVLVDVPKSRDQREVKELLWSVTQLEHPVASVLLTDETGPRQNADFLRAGAASCLSRGVTLRKLAHTLHVLTFHVSAGEPANEDFAGLCEAHVLNPDPSFYVLSAEMVQMMEQVRRVIPQDTTILFTGETGTGKTRTARLIHEMSPRREEPFLVVDCNSLSPSLIESELFGHVKGAFTGADRDRPGKFAAVGKGTIVLDEINSLPLSLQAKLLRVVDDRVFEPVGSNQSQPLLARLITITNASLEEEVAAGRFRADLYYRLNVVGFYLPPLRERTSAIGPLAKKFLGQFAAKNRPDKTSIAPEAIRILERYHWPGNIRELGNVLERAVTLFPGPAVQASHLPEPLRANYSMYSAVGSPRPDAGRALSGELGLIKSSASGDDLTLVKSKEKAEILCIREALRKHRNNRLRAAAELGISRMALYKKLHKYGMLNTA